MPAVEPGRIQQRLARRGQVDHPLETPLRIDHRQHRRVGPRHHGSHLTQRRIDLHARILVADQLIQVHQRQDRLVAVVRQQVTALRDTLGIDGIFLEEAQGPERHRRRKDQRNQQLVAAGNFGDEEDGRHRGLHHAGHQRRHTHQHEILLRHAETQQVDAAGDHEAEDGAREQGRTEGTAHSPASVGGRHCQDLQEEDQREAERHAPAPVKQESQDAAAFQVEFPAVEQRAERIIALAVERREQEDQQTQRHRAQNPSQVGTAEFTDLVLEEERRPHEIERTQPAEDAEHDVERDIPHRERRQRAGEDRRLPPEDVCDHRRRDGGNQQRQQRGHGHVE